MYLGKQKEPQMRMSQLAVSFTII